MEPAALLQAIYKAFRENRLADALSHLGDDFKLSVRLPSDGGPGNDRTRSKAESALLFRKFTDRFDILSYESGPIIVSADTASAQPELTIRHRKTGKTLEMKLAHSWHVADGKARELNVRYDLQKAEQFLISVGEELF
jgi:ketosteroid isomerase-like protein